MGNIVRRRNVAVFLVASALGLVFGLVCFPPTHGIGLGKGFARDFSNVGLAIAALGAGAAMGVRASRAKGRQRLSWALLAASAASWGGGQTIWAIYESILGKQPFPSAADIGYLGEIPTIVAGLLLMPNLPSRAAGRLRVLTDGGLIAASLAMISWTFLLGEQLHTPADSRLAQVISIAYPIGDIVSASVALFVLSHAMRTRDVSPWVVLLITGGVVGFATSDSWFAVSNLHGTYYSGSPVDIGWFSAFLLLAVAGLHRSTGEASHSPAATRTATAFALVVPYAAVIAAITLTAAEVWIHHRLTMSQSVCALIIMILGAIRHVLATQVNQRLRRHLEARVQERTRELATSAARFTALVTHSSDVIFVLDPSGRVTYASPSVHEIFGLDTASLDDAPFARLLKLGEAALVLEEIAAAAGAPYSTRTLSFALRGGDGRWRQTETVVTSLVDDPAVQGLVLNCRDITERSELEAQLVHQAFHDVLTRLPNRALFRDRVAHALVAAPRHGASVAVLFLDLDGFKAVNDSLGHDAGDQLLLSAAQRFEHVVRPGDTVARLGGDEFAVLLEDVAGADEAGEVGQRLIEALAEPFVISGRPILVGGSVGVALAHALDGSSPGASMPTTEELLRNADLAMYRAKANGRGGIAHFEPGMHASLVARVQEEADLRAALEEGQLRLEYQPTYRLADGALTGVEALLRWDHPVRGLVPPNDFIPLAEQTGLIVPIGSWVLREACRQAVEWAADGRGAAGLTLAVNVSARQLQNDGFADIVAQCLRQTGLAPDRLVLELTESVLLEHDEVTVATLRAIRASGVRIAVDDFGTGYSSLSYLSRFPVDLLKVDRSFVDRLGDGESESSALARSIVQLGHSLALTTVAEGIEQPDQLRALQAMGCEYGQGFYFAKPVRPEEIAKMIAAPKAPPQGSAPASERALAL
ncbi:MAG TPA: EAL domain-containing protein [Mycobacteriales bacterium]|nr:EAL domain-containing protein [Mycobacteriales bacterium]